MIYLDSPTKSLMVTLDAIVAANQVDVSANFFDVTPQSTTQLKRGGVQVAQSNNTSDVTMVSAPALQGIVRNVQTIFVNNKDTATRTVTVKLDDAGSQKILVKQSIAAGESLVYEDNSGWQILSPITPPFVDTTPLVHGSSDVTKQVRIEVDGLTTSTTRVWTAPDADITVAGSAAALTANRFVYTGAGGLLTADGNVTYNGTNASINPSGTLALSPTGALTINPATLGNIDNTRIGFSTRAAIQATTADFSGNLSVTKTGAITVTLDNRTGGNVGSALQMLGWNTLNKNWQIDVGLTTAGINFTPSTAAGGSTFTTSVATLSEAGALTLSAGLGATTGNFSSTLIVSGHTTFEGVTSTGATGTGKLVYDTSPTIATPIINSAAHVGGSWVADATWTLPAHTLGGTVSGGGNQINNVIIGTSTPLAGTFTTLTVGGANPATTGKINVPNNVNIIIGRNAANNADRTILAWDSGNTILIASSGDTTRIVGPLTTDTTASFGGDVTITTQSVGNNTTKAASTAFVSAFSQQITNSLGADVALNNSANYFDGPSVAQGTSGTWYATGTVTLSDSSPAQYDVKLWDGTTVIASATHYQSTSNTWVSVSLSGYIASPAGNIRISAKDVSANTGKIIFNKTGNSKDATVSAFKVAN